MRGFAIIAAGGLGKRMNLASGVSKQLLRLGGKPVLCHTLSAFEQASSIEGVYVAAGAAHLDTLRRLVRRYGFSKVNCVIEGGAERQDSIYNCIERLAQELETLSAREKKQCVVLIHDGARPFIQPSEIDAIAMLSKQFGACVPATKPKDTIKRIGADARFFGATLDRSSLLQVQTPQGFSANLIIAAHRLARQKKFYATDDAALIEKFFPTQRIKIFETGYHNLKLTTPEDLDFGVAILKRLRLSQKQSS